MGTLQSKGGKSIWKTSPKSYTKYVGSSGSIYENCGDVQDRLRFDNMDSGAANIGNMMGSNNASLHLDTFSLQKTASITFRDNSSPFLISVGDLEGDSTGALVMGAGQTMIVRGKKKTQYRTPEALPYVSYGVASDGVIVTNVATVEYMQLKLNHTGFDITVPYSATIIMPQVVRIFQTNFKLGGHLDGVKSMIITGGGKLHILETASQKAIDLDSETDTNTGTKTTLIHKLRLPIQFGSLTVCISLMVVNCMFTNL